MHEQNYKQQVRINLRPETELKRIDSTTVILDITSIESMKRVE